MDKRSEESSKEVTNSSYVSLEEIEEKIIFWPEIFDRFHKFRYQPFGSSSLPVPTFHLENGKKIFDSAPREDYQYGEMIGRQDLRENILNYFPLVQLYRDQNIKVSLSNVLVTNGVVPGISVAIDALCEPDDE